MVFSFFEEAEHSPPFLQVSCKSDEELTGVSDIEKRISCKAGFSLEEPLYIKVKVAINL